METTGYNIKELANLLSRGADERIFLNKEGLTKYGTPLVRDNYVNRGSCTCSAARNNDIELINNLLTANQTKDDWIEYKDLLEKELKHELGCNDSHNFELFFAPSGTDLVYYPLIFSQLLHPEVKVNSLVTCVEELGSGTRNASQGRFYASYNQFGKEIKKGEPISPCQQIQSIFLNARSENGEIYNNAESVRKIIDEHPEERIIVYLVYGSKSGIEDDLKLIDKIQADNLQWVVDMCQFRHSRDILHKLISKGAMVMITGSKFYESAPFSGAMLVPKSVCTRLERVEDWGSAKDYQNIFSKYDLPSFLSRRAPFTDKVNVAGLLRWACALSSIKDFKVLNEVRVEDKITNWRDAIFSLLNASNSFELMPHQELTNKSIVSFRVLKEGVYLNTAQLKELYFSIVKGDYSNAYPFDHITIGQPVSYGAKAFLRLAIGAKSIKQLVEEDEQNFTTDKKIIEIIENKLAALEIYQT